jgi:putative two-component system response regulator
MTHQILIVDDNNVNLILFSVLVKQLGNCQERTFSDPLEALVWAENKPTDLVVVDYRMPQIDGLEFIRRFRQLPGHGETPVLMVTADSQKDVRYAALDLGASDFLTKPIDRFEFLSRAKNLLALQDSRHKLADRATWLADEVRKATSELVERERETVLLLAKAAEFRDPNTGAHILRMAMYSQLIGSALGLSKAEQELLLEAAPMHDIGKVGIPDDILLKAGKLDAPEFEIMKRHARIGYEILRESSSVVLQTGAEIAHSHHEKFDGSGYPDGLKGDEIPLFSRIVAVADVFDALTSARPYKLAWSLDRAVAYLKVQSGRHFDPRCVGALLEKWDEVLAIRTRFGEQGDVAQGS